MKHWRNRVLAITFYDTFDKSAMKIFSVFSCGHIKFAICSTSLNFYENLVENPPFERPTQLWRSMRKLKQLHVRRHRLVLFADWPEKYFSGQSKAGNSNASGTSSVRLSAQGLVALLQ